jgi:hypothetical protein
VSKLKLWRGSKMVSHSKIASLIKSHFPDFNFNDYHINAKNGIVKIEERKRGKLIPDELLSNYIKERYFSVYTENSLYHYLPINYVENIENGKLRLYNLAKYINNGNDVKEFSFFFDKMRILFPKPEQQLKNLVDNIFVLSCTTKRNSDEHWKMFGQNEGACIHFNLKIKKDKNVVDVRNVVYESELTKLFCLKQCIKEQFDYELELSNFNLFSKFTKRSFYEWEKEVRICFDNNINKINKKINTLQNDKYFKIMDDIENRCKYIEIPLQNDFFEIKIKDISYRKEDSENY